MGLSPVLIGPAIVSTPAFQNAVNRNFDKRVGFSKILDHAPAIGDSGAMPGLCALVRVAGADLETIRAP
jgi:hypothetical protein